jgi:hypothetical protein
VRVVYAATGDVDLLTTALPLLRIEHARFTTHPRAVEVEWDGQPQVRFLPPPVFPYRF